MKVRRMTPVFVEAKLESQQFHDSISVVVGMFQSAPERWAAVATPSDLLLTWLKSSQRPLGSIVTSSRQNRSHQLPLQYPEASLSSHWCWMGAGSSSRSTKRTGWNGPRRNQKWTKREGTERREWQAAPRQGCYVDWGLSGWEISDHFNSLNLAGFCFYLTLCFCIDFFFVVVLYLQGWIRAQESRGRAGEWRSFLKIAAILWLIASCASWFHTTSRVSGSASGREPGSWWYERTEIETGREFGGGRMRQKEARSISKSVGLCK